MNEQRLADDAERRPAEAGARGAALPEILLVAWGLAFSTGYFHAAAAAGIAAGLWLASDRSWRRDIVVTFAGIAIAAFLAFSGFGSLGPAVHAAAIAAGAAAWMVVGAHSRTRMRAGESSPGLPSLVAFVPLALAALAQRAATGYPPYLWMASPIDLGIVLLVLGLQSLTAARTTAARVALLVLLAAVLLASTSRGVLVAGAVAVFVLFPRRRRAVVLGLVAIAVIALPLVAERIATDSLAWGRPRIWAGALELISLRPVGGWGLGDYPNASRLDLIADPEAARFLRRPVYAHNDLLQLVAEIGIPLAAWTLAGLAGLAIRGRGVGERSASTVDAPTEARVESVDSATPPVSTAVLAALVTVSLAYFPFQLGWPLAAAAWHLGLRLAPLRARPASDGEGAGTAAGARRVLLRLAAAAALVYGWGLASADPALARWDARLAIQSGDAAGVYRMLELEEGRAESWMNVGMLAARHGSRGGAVRSFQAAVDRAPAEAVVRIELARAWAWWGSDPARDTGERIIANRRIAQELGWVRATEPLALSGADALGDSVASRHARMFLDLAASRHEPREHLEILARRADVP